MKGKYLIVLSLMLLLLTSACISKQYTNTLDDGTKTKMTSVGDTGFLTRGTTLTVTEICFPNEPCIKKVHETTNPTVAEQLAGPGATVGAGYFIGKGLGDSGTNVSNNSGSVSAAGAVSSSRASARSSSRGGMRGWAGD